MRANSTQINEVLDWIGNDPFKEALLIAEAPIGRTTLLQMQKGSYIPGERLIKALLSVKEKYPQGLPNLGGLRHTAS